MLVVCCYYYIYDQQGLVSMILQDVWGKSEFSPLVIFNQNLKTHHLRKT